MRGLIFLFSIISFRLLYGHQLKLQRFHRRNRCFLSRLKLKISGIFDIRLVFTSQFGKFINSFHCKAIFNLLPQQEIDNIVVFVLDVDFPELVFEIYISDFTHNCEKFSLNFVFFDHLHES